MSNTASYSNDDLIVNSILQRSATDKEFRTRLLSDPNTAIEEVIGAPVATLPKPFRVKFIEKRPGEDAVVVLPDFSDPDAALSDAELESVAGGDWCITSCGWTITVCDYTTNNQICKA